MRGDFQKILCPKPLDSYSPLIKWATVRLMLILQIILGLQSQSIEFKNTFSQADIPCGEPVFIELPMDSNSYGVKGGVVLRLKKSLYGQARATRICDVKLQNGLLERAFLMSKMDPCMYMSKTVICVVNVYDFLF